MSKKQKMKMLVAVLAAGSLYMSNGTAFAAIVGPISPNTGMTQDSEDNNITIIVDEDMDIDIEEDGSFNFVFNKPNNSGDTIDSQIGQINFSTTGGTDGKDKQVVISSLGSLELAKDEDGRYIFKNENNSEQEYIYFDPDTKSFVNENGDFVDEDETMYYQPVFKPNFTEHTLDVGSVVGVTSVDNNGNKIATSITVNGEKFDTISTEFSGGSQSNGTYHGWSATDKITGNIYADTTLNKVTNTEIKGSNGEIYGNNYIISDTAGNKLDIKDVASAGKLEQVDGKVNNLTSTVGSSTTEEMKNAYKDTNYIHTAENMNEADIILDKNLGNLSTTVGSTTTEEMKNVYKDTNYIYSAGNMNDADIILDKNLGDLSTAIGVKNVTDIHNNYANTNYISGATNMVDADVKLDAAIKNETDIRYEQDRIINNRIDGLGSRVDSLDGRISKVGAGAAALAALHPLDFDPDDKLSFAVGYGNYRGENATALGAFYQPNEDTLFSVGGTIGNDENMVNVGVSFKLGQKNHVSNNRVSMAKEIISLRDKVAKLEALMIQQGMIPQSEIDVDKFFPDVPENHWAYEYVRELARLGIIDGYPDGTFSGDRTMTRYEFAAITYRALQKGVNVDKRMITEFEPELKLIRVDTIATDKDGNPTIERVRTIEQEEK